jgi:hypothetical protein
MNKISGKMQLKNPIRKIERVILWILFNWPIGMGKDSCPIPLTKRNLLKKEKKNLPDSFFYICAFLCILYKYFALFFSKLYCWRHLLFGLSTLRKSLSLAKLVAFFLKEDSTFLIF